MSLTRALFAVLAALCLAVLSAGLAPALAHGAGGHASAVDTAMPAAVAAGHAVHQHDGATVDAAVAAKATTGHCADDGNGSSPGASACCGFACHAVFPVHLTVLGVQGRRLALPMMPQDAQVGANRPSMLERPPRIG